MKTLLLSLLLSFFCASNSPAVLTNAGEVYAKPAVIIAVDCANDIAVAEDADGMTWEFYGCVGYNVGDPVNLLMWDNGTADTILDDVVLYAE